MLKVKKSIARFFTKKVFINKNKPMARPKFPNRTKKHSEKITVIIGVHKRVNENLKLALNSIQNQDYPKKLIKIIIIDYSNTHSDSRKLKKIAEKYLCTLIGVRKNLDWNRAHCINIGIKNAKTRYVLISDSDILFEDNYFSEAISAIEENNKRAVWCTIKDIPKHIKIPNKISSNDYLKLKKSSNERKRTNPFHKPMGVGVILTKTSFLKKIGGYDEEYLLWGYEDRDLAGRLAKTGVDLFNIQKRTSALHLWHEKFEGVNSPLLRNQILKNRAHYWAKKGIVVRNLKGWGNKTYLQE